MAQQEQNTISMSNRLVLLAVALVPVVFATAFSSFEDVKWGVMLALSGLGAIAFAIDIIRGKAVTVQAGRVATIAYVFSAFVLFAATYAPVPMLGLAGALTWVSGSILFLLALSSSGRGLRFADLAMSVAVAVLGVGVFGLLDVAGVGITTVVWDPLGAPGAFDSIEFLAPFYAGALPLLIAAAIRVSGRRKAVFVVALILGAIHFGLTVSSTLAFITVSAVLAVSVVVVILQKPARAVLLYPVFGVFFAVSILVGLFVMFGQPEQTFSDANRLPLATFEPVRMEQLVDGKPRVTNFAIGRTEEIRDVAAWNYTTGVALDLFRDQPIGGQGAGSWWTMQTQFPRVDDPFVTRMFEQYPAFKSAHNSLAQLLAEYGLIGMLLFIGWMSSVVVITLGSLASREEPENWVIEHWGLAASVTALFACSVRAPGLDMAGSAVIFFPVLALLVREGAVLNNFRGLSAPTMFGGEHKSLSGKFFGGLVPIIVGFLLIGFAGVVTVSNYHRGLADHLMLRTKFVEAGVEYAAAHEAFPYRGDVVYDQALTIRRGGKIQDAKDLIATAERLRPNDARILAMVAILASTNQQDSEVVLSASRAIALFPNYLEAHKQLALGYDMGGRVTEAAKAVKGAIDLNPPERFKSTLYAEMARYYEDALGQPKLASEAYKNAAKLTKDQVNRNQYETNAKELDKQIERDRLMREGKPVPKELYPAQQGHDHGLPDNLQPNVPPPGNHGHAH